MKRLVMTQTIRIVFPLTIPQLLRWTEWNLINEWSWIWRVEITVAELVFRVVQIEFSAINNSKLWQFPDFLIWQRSYLEISGQEMYKTFRNAPTGDAA